MNLGQTSFDRLAGSIEGTFDFRHRRENGRLILDPSTGLVVDLDDRHAEHE